MGGEERGTRPATASAAEEDPNAAVVCSSPPCFMHELDPAYLGYLDREEASALLDGLLAADWGGAVPDEARLRAGLRRHIQAPGTSCETPAAEPARRGPDGLARTIREALPRVHDDTLRRDLQEVLGGLDRGGGTRQGTAFPGGA